MPSFTVLTLNSWKCDGDYPKRLELMRYGIAALQPDICLLQESFVADALGWNTAEKIAEPLGHTVAYGPARRKKREIDGQGVESTSGLAILTRGTIESSRIVPLPDTPEDGERIAQIAEIALDGARILVVNIHLTFVLGRDELRKAELTETLSSLPPLKQYDAAVMGGDFNCPPDSAPIRWLLGETGHTVTDTAADADYITYGGGRSRPPQRIDYLFLLETGRTARAVEVTRVLDVPDPDTGILPSDHFGVLARIETQV